MNNAITRKPNDFIIEDDVCKISIRNKYGDLLCYALIDVEDINKCKPYKWCINAAGYIWSNGAKQYLHQLISGIVNVDHVNRNKQDCRKNNFREASKQENSCNRTLSSANTTGYKGVSYNSARNKYFAQIKVNGKHRWLGYFDEPIQAALAYNKAAKALHGEFAYQNPVLLKRIKP